MYHAIGDATIFIYKYGQSVIYILAGLLAVAINNKVFLNKKLNLLSSRESLVVIQKAQLYLVALFFSSYLALQYLPNDIDSVYSGILCLKEMVLFSVLSIIIIGIVCVIFDRILIKKNLDTSLCTWTIFIICLIQLMALGKPVIEDWASTYYVLDYSLGFGSRMFMGTLLSLFYDDFLPEVVAVRFVMFFVIMFIFLCSYMMACCVDKVSKESKKGMAFLIGVALACPGSIQAVCENFGRLEMYGFMAVLFEIIWILKFKEKKLVKYLGINVINIIMMLIYQGNIFLVFPAIFGLMLFECIDEKWDIKELVSSAVTTIILCISFLVTQFYNPAFETHDERVMKELVKSKTDMSCATGPLVNEYYKPLKDVWEDINFHYFIHDGADASRFFPWISTAFTIVLIMPLVVLLIVFWKHQWRMYKDKGLSFWKNPISWICLSFTAIIPDMLLNIDWGRWFVAILFVQFSLVFYMIYKELGDARVLVLKTADWVNHNLGLAICFIVYLSLLGNFYDCSFLDIVQNFVGVIKE